VNRALSHDTQTSNTGCCAYAHTCDKGCVCVCVRACVRACVCVRVCVFNQCKHEFVANLLPSPSVKKLENRRNTQLFMSNVALIDSFVCVYFYLLFV